jgi:hypothetical protein
MPHSVSSVVSVQDAIAESPEITALIEQRHIIAGFAYGADKGRAIVAVAYAR